MDWPIDTAKGVFIASDAPQPVIDFDTKRQKADGDGQPLFQVPMVALINGGAEVIKVKVPGEPRGIAPQSPVKCVGLTMSFFAMVDEKGRHVAMPLYRAERVELLAPSRSTPAAAAS